MPQSVWRLGAALAIAAGLALLSLEGLLASGLAYPEFLRYAPPRLVDAFRRYYSKFDRDLVQFNSECAVYDPELFYRLRPGRCAFVNREFETQLEINSVGVRDDEASLRAPEVVVLGDSLAMGWGVAQTETFAEQLERELNVPVLNAAISSYGTVREMKLLAQLDTSAMRTLIIQYCSNDFEENAAFFDSGNRLLTSAESDWQTIVTANGSRRRHVFGEHIWRVLAFVRNGSHVPIDAVAASRAGDGGVQSRPRSESPAQLFLNSLMHAAAIDLAHVELIVVPLESWHRNSPSFATELARTLESGAYPPAIRRATIVDLSPHLTDRHYFLLDGHLNAAGHAEVAKRLRGVLAGSG